jgi:hypothetical protein
MVRTVVVERRRIWSDASSSVALGGPSDCSDGSASSAAIAGKDSDSANTAPSNLPATNARERFMFLTPVVVVRQP